MQFSQLILIGLGINFHRLFWDDANFKFAAENTESQVGTYMLERSTIKVYDVTNWHHSNSFYIIDVNAFGSLIQLKPLQEVGFTIKGFIKGLRNESNAEGVRMMNFEYLTYYKLNFVDNPRILKVTVSD